MRVTTYKIKDIVGRVERIPNARRVIIQYKGYTRTVTYYSDKRSNYVLVILTAYVLLKKIVKKS